MATGSQQNFKSSPRPSLLYTSISIFYYWSRQDREGVPIRAILFGDRCPAAVPLLLKKAKEIMHQPFTIPFFVYYFGDYLTNRLRMGPSFKIFHINWIRESTERNLTCDLERMLALRKHHGAYSPRTLLSRAIGWIPIWCLHKFFSFLFSLNKTIFNLRQRSDSN